MRKLAAIALLAFALLFLGCVSPEEDNGVSGTGTTQNGGGTTALLVQVYFKGPVEGAAVNIYSLNADGSKNELIAGPVQTDETGSAYPEIPELAGRFLVESTDGAYSDDAGQPISDTYAGKQVSLPAGYSMRALIPAGNSVAVVSPFTEMAASLAYRSIRKGTALDEAARAANIAVNQQYRQENVIWRIPAVAFNPYDVAVSSKEAREYGLLLAGLVEEAHKMNVEPALLAVALAEDWSDGKLDGKQDGKSISLETESGSKISLSASAGLADLQKGINAFLASAVDATQIKQFPITSAQVSTDPSFYIDTDTLPAWIDGQQSSYTLKAVGGKPAYSWKLKKGSSMPSGFSLSPEGVISGTGRLQGSVGSISPPFTVVVTDSSQPPQSREIELRIELVPTPPQLEVRDVECEVGVECSVNLISNVVGGTSPYYFIGYATDKGQYPLDLLLGIDGVLRGTPTHEGDFAMQACVVDLIGWSDCQDVNVYISERSTPTPTARATAEADGGEISCEPGHYAVYCGGAWRCCLNGWVCVGGGRCAPG